MRIVADQTRDFDMSTNEMPKTQEEAAAFLGLKPSTLAAWRHQGRGPRYIKIGRSCFYRGSDLDAWIEAQAVIPAPKNVAAE
jgi:predicted DNA-binding transcriptional regulator AlpA